MIDNKDLYPTPDDIIKKMIDPYIQLLESRGYRTKPYMFNNRKTLNILEPSAGKGNIVDWINDNIEVRKKDKIYAIETDSDLQHILRGKNCRLIDTNFLQYSGDYRFDLIVMNPPFSEGDKHLMKAWEVVRNGDIVCLLNYETINNPYSKPRKLLCDIIKEHGEYEYLGNVFSDSERETDVEVALVRLYKRQEQDDFDFSFENVGGEERNDLSEDTVQDTLAFNDITGNMLRQYEKTKEAYIDYIKARQKLRFYSQGLINKNKSIESLAGDSYKEASNLNDAYNNFLDEFKFHAWKHILEKLNIEKYLTQKEFDKFQDFAKQQGNVDLTKENIRQLVELLIYNRNNIMENAIVEVFDIFTKYYKENRIHVEGWKTNDFWKVNKKVILPNFIHLSWGGDRFEVNYRLMREFEDIDKVMAYITGKDFGYIKRIGDAVREYPVGDTSRHKSEFFEIRCFKKGTIHLWFHDKWLWEKFNQRAVKGKNWLGGDA